MAESANKEVTPRMEKAPKKEKTSKKSWIKGLKSEFKKIIWTDKRTLFKQTVAVVAVTAVSGIIISVMDSVVLQLINFLVK